MPNIFHYRYVTVGLLRKVLVKNYVTMSEYDDLKDEVKSLRRIRKLQQDGTTPEKEQSSKETFNRFTYDRLVQLSSTYEFLFQLMIKLFSKDEIKSCSVSGKAANSKTALKAALSPGKFCVMKRILKEQFKITNGQFTTKVLAVQKRIRLEN